MLSNRACCVALCKFESFGVMSTRFVRYLFYLNLAQRVFQGIYCQRQNEVTCFVIYNQLNVSQVKLYLKSVMYLKQSNFKVNVCVFFFITGK